MGKRKSNSSGPGGGGAQANKRKRYGNQPSTTPSSTPSKSPSTSPSKSPTKTKKDRPGSLSGPGRNNPNRRKSPVSTPTKTPTKTVTKTPTKTSPDSNKKSTKTDGPKKKSLKTIRAERAEREAARKKVMQDKARDRHTKFKQTRVQTHGGKRTNFTKAEQKRIKKAGYSVDGYSKAKAKSNTQLQVDRDNRKYGNTVPKGSFGISKEGKKSAAEQRIERRKAEIAKKKTTSSDKLFGKYKAQIGGKLATTFADTMAKPKYMYQGNMAGRAPGLSNYFTPDVGTGMPYMKGGKLRGIPFTGGDAAGSLTRFKVPDGAKLSRSPLGVRQFKLNPSQMKNLGMGVTDDVSKFAAKGLGKYGLRAVPFVGAVPSLVDAGVRFKDKDYTGAALSAASAIPGKVGWASLAGLAAHDINKSMNVGTTASATAGGLNISSGGVDSKEPTGSSTGRTIVSTDRDKNISYDIGGIAKDVGLGLADVATLNKFDFDNLGRPRDNKTFTQKFETFKKSPLQQAIISKQTGIDAKRLINEGESAAKSLFKNYVGDIDASTKKGVRQPIARFLKDVGSDDATAMAGRAIDAFGYDDPNFSNEPNKLTKFLSSVSPIPNLSEENVQDIRHTLNKTVKTPTGIQGKSILKNVPYNQALGFANRIVSGKLSDATGEAMNQLGIGNVGDIDNAVNLGMQINTNRQTEGTVANQRFGELDNLIQQYGPGKGQIPTLPSIIRGIGGAARRGGGSGNQIQIQGGNNMTALLPITQEVPQELLPMPSITMPPQTGTDSSDLASIMQNAYQNQMSLYGMDPNYFANIRQPRFNTRPKRFRQVFNRGYF